MTWDNLMARTDDVHPIVLTHFTDTICYILLQYRKAIGLEIRYGVILELNKYLCP